MFINLILPESSGGGARRHEGTKARRHEGKKTNTSHLLLVWLFIATSPASYSSRASAAQENTYEPTCKCSPWSGNLKGDCCDGTGNNTCGSWFHHATCSSDRPVCCTSSFESVCCADGDACSPGCRNSLAGKCDCLPSPSLTGTEYDRSS